MKASVTSTDTLKLRSRAGSRLASMKCSMSGWSMRKQPIIAPRRCPADITVRHMASHASMNESGPDACAPTPRTGAPAGRMVEKSIPTPPPCCMVRAASRKCSKMPSRLSGMVPITKQLNKVTVRPVPAPAMMRPAGRNLKPESAVSNCVRQCRRARAGSASAIAAATRDHVASTPPSPPSPSTRKRYFAFQISAEISASNGISSAPSYNLHAPVSVSRR